MKKLLFIFTAVSALLMGCSKQEDMTSAPATAPSTNSASTNATK